MSSDDVLVTLAIKIGELSTRLTTLEQKVAAITETQKEVVKDTIIPSAEELQKAVDAMKEALSSNLGIAQNVLSFDINEDGSLRPVKEDDSNQ